ncbi:SDR family NAD(P)-dependent oxidoreductase [Brevibacterium sp. R8603A2]|uniref:SDR family NAD(P)-dependent oxidoreductase n=1 Tax=Brevibacterium sp. R8603A2 TaxID=2929779 RepID=UPI0024A69529|nr:SDR family NAD(P)-dependent oxidoreductase [Brevibacterium sp. R8603A2]
MAGRPHPRLAARRGAARRVPRRRHDRGVPVPRTALGVGIHLDAAGPALAVPCDVSRPEDLSTLVDTAVEQFGGIDLLVNNAGVSRRNSVAQEDEEFERVWQEVLDINLSSAGDPRRSTGGEVRSSPGRSSTRKGLHPAASEDRFDGSIRRIPRQAVVGARRVD